MKQPAELLRRLSLLRVKALLCGHILGAEKLQLMIETVEYLLDLDTPGAKAMEICTTISPEEVEMLTKAEEVYTYYMTNYPPLEKK